MRTVRAKLTEHTTVLRLRDIKYGQNLDDGLFTIRKLEQGL